MRFSAILFDLDGTLIETIGLYGRAYDEVFRQHGATVTSEQFLDLYHRGVSIEETLRSLAGPDVDTSTVRARRDKAYIKLLRREAEYLEGAGALLEATKDVPRAVVTGSWMTYVDAIDEKLGIAAHFPVIIAADHMKPFYKPHPHGFLLAADRLGVEPKDCLVIGDQLFDVDGAKAAGMMSCLIWNAHTPKNAAGKADKEVRSLAELLRLLTE